MAKVYPYTTNSLANPFVLVVDDDADAAEILSLLLRQQGYIALPVGSGAEAMRVLEKIVPALVILDVMMPGIDGLQVLRWIRGHNGLARLPVLMYTADQSAEVESTAMRSGAQGYFVKGRVLFRELLGAVGEFATAHF